MLNYNGLRSTEDYWNESRNSYEVRFANHSYEIKVETTGFTCRRLTCYLGCDDMMLRYVDLPADLLEFVKSAIRKDPNFKYYDDSVFDEKLL